MPVYGGVLLLTRAVITKVPLKPGPTIQLLEVILLLTVFATVHHGIEEVTQKNSGIFKLDGALSFNTIDTDQVLLFVYNKVYVTISHALE